MNIWRVDVIDEHEGTMVKWFARKKYALEYQKEVKHVRKQAALLTEYYVLNTKDGIVNFLNDHFTLDNG